MKTYNLEKWIWSENDFEEMGWHNCLIYAIQFNGKISLDLDYAIEWNTPEAAGMPFTFWVSPATLIFDNVTLFKVDFSIDFTNGIAIYGVIRREIDNTTEWTIKTHVGSIIIHSDSFTQIIRRAPTFQLNNFIPHEERGDQYFASVPEKDYQESKELTQKRENEFELYKLCVQRFKLKNKLESLNHDNMDIKEFLLTKKDLNEQIESVNKKLAGTNLEKY